MSDIQEKKLNSETFPVLIHKFHNKWEIILYLSIVLFTTFSLSLISIALATSIDPTIATSPQFINNTTNNTINNTTNNNITCDSTSFYSLDQWLTMYCVVGFVLTSITGLMIGSPFPIKMIITVYIFYQIMMNVVNVIGCIVLFEHSMDCLEQKKGLWIITCVDLICQWIINIMTIILMMKICCGKYSIKEKNDIHN